MTFTLVPPGVVLLRLRQEQLRRLELRHEAQRFALQVDRPLQTEVEGA